MRFRCADLFCGAGGAAMGLSRAGFAHIEGWDILTGLHYPFERRIGDALEADLSRFDFVWASPPCQKHSGLAHRTGKDYECYIDRTREKLEKWGGPYVIENVDGAPLKTPIMLCGSMFSLNVRRHRLFESNLPIFVNMQCRHDKFPAPIDVTGTGSRRKVPRTDGKGGDSRKPRNLAEAQSVMEMPWASRKEISQAIPPAYSEYIGRQIIRYLIGAYSKPLNLKAREFAIQTEIQKAERDFGG